METSQVCSATPIFFPITLRAQIDDLLLLLTDCMLILNNLNVTSAWQVQSLMICVFAEFHSEVTLHTLYC